MSGILGLWYGMVQILGVLAVLCIGLGLMVGVLEPSRAFVRLGGVIGCMVLLLQLPAILVGIWQSLSFWQRMGILIVLFIVTAAMLRYLSTSRQGRSSRH